MVENEAREKRAISVDGLDELQKERGLTNDATIFAGMPFQDAELLALLMENTETSRKIVVAEKKENLKESFLGTDILDYKDHPKIGPKVRRLIKELGIEE